MQGKTKYWMFAAAAFIAFACIFPETVKPKYSPELEENAVIRMQLFSDKYEDFLLMPDNTLYYIDEGDIGKREPNVTYTRNFMKPPCIFVPEISIIKRVKLTKEQVRNINELMYQVILEKDIAGYDDAVYIDLEHEGVHYWGRYTDSYLGGALENLYVLFCDFCEVTDLPNPSEFSS